MVLTDKSEELFETVVEVLLREKIVIMRGDTIYGFFGIAPETKEKIESLKKRKEGKNFLMVIPDVSWVNRFSNDRIPDELLSYWPGPLTVIMKARENLWGSPTVALRVPDDSFLQQVLRRIDKPLYSTSVNISGERELNGIEEIIKKFGNRVELIVDSGDAHLQKPSTIVDITGKKIVVVREGAIKREDLYSLHF